MAICYCYFHHYISVVISLFISDEGWNAWPRHLVCVNRCQLNGSTVCSRACPLCWANFEPTGLFPWPCWWHIDWNIAWCYHRHIKMKGFKMRMKIIFNLSFWSWRRRTNLERQSGPSTEPSLHSTFNSTRIPSTGPPFLSPFYFLHVCFILKIFS